MVNVEKVWVVIIVVKKGQFWVVAMVLRRGSFGWLLR